MASGVKVDDDVVDEYQKIKLGHKYKYVLFKLSSNNEKIVVHSSEPNLETTYEEFCAALPTDDCRYAVYDLKLKVADGGDRDKLVFYVWCPDTAPVKKKMLYASSKDALKKKLVGVGTEIQATDASELDFELVKEKVLRS